MDGVGISIVGRPRPLSRPRRADRLYTLIWEDPDYCSGLSNRWYLVTSTNPIRLYIDSPIDDDCSTTTRAPDANAEFVDIFVRYSPIPRLRTSDVVLTQYSPPTEASKNTIEQAAVVPST